jgi:hypothetical protein
MGTVPFNCPHVGCLTKNVGLTTHSVVSIDGGVGNLFATCPVCNRGIILYIEKRGNDPIGNAAGRSGETFSDSFRILSSAPSVPTLDVIGNLPPQIQQTFSEAEANFVDGRLMSSAIMFRKTVELTVRDLNPEGKGMLNSRIRALQKEEAVPDTLIRLLDTVKFLGNEGAHDEEPPSVDDVERGRDFTRLFLVYSYELPARIASALPNEEPA